MPNGIPAFPSSLFPNQKPPTLFHPASPILKPTEMSTANANNNKAATTATSYGTMSEKDTDNASLASTNTFSSSVSLLKKKFSSKHQEQKPKKEKKVRSPDEWNARARTAEAYYIQATMK